jgi:hypothetical protein
MFSRCGPMPIVVMALLTLMIHSSALSSSEMRQREKYTTTSSDAVTTTADCAVWKCTLVMASTWHSPPMKCTILFVPTVCSVSQQLS